MLVVLSSLFFPDLSIILFPLGTNKTLQQVSRGDICWEQRVGSLSYYRSSTMFIWLTWKVAVSSASALGTEDETEQVAETRPRPREERARCSNMALMLAGDCCVTETRDKEIMREITDHLSYLLQNGEHSTSWQCNQWSASMQFSGSIHTYTHKVYFLIIICRNTINQVNG